MSLFGAVQQSTNSLRVNELGLQVTGNNIANANTPGYIRQELLQSTAIGVRVGDAIIGYGVRAVGVVQKLDNFVLQRLRETTSELAFNEQLSSANSQIETAIGELGENDISSLMSRFANAFSDVANQPGNNSFKTLVLERGKELAEGLQSLSNSAVNIQQKSVQDIRGAASEINRLSSQIAKLNTRIVEMEGGRLSGSDAVGLRDERLRALDELATYVNLQAVEQANGSVTVLVGGDYLVADGLPREVTTFLDRDDSGGRVEIRLADTDAPLQVTAGKLRGFYDARDGVAGDFIAKVDNLSREIIQTVNRIHSQGQGATGLREVLSDYVVDNEFAPLEQSGLSAPIDNGTMTVSVRDARTGLTQTYDVIVRAQGLPTDTTTVNLVSQFDAISGITATLTNDGRIRLKSDSEAIQFSFSNDTSGALAALGINTFFRGDSAGTIEVRSELSEQPNLLAVSLDGIGVGAGNALKLAAAFETAIDDLGGLTLREIYESDVIDTTQKINSQKGVTEGLRNFQQTLEAQHLGTSGVSLDEEAIRMMLYQRAFQATSRLISTANDLLETLVTMV